MVSPEVARSNETTTTNSNVYQLRPSNEYEVWSIQINPILQSAAPRPPTNTPRTILLSRVGVSKKQPFPNILLQLLAVIYFSAPLVFTLSRHDVLMRVVSNNKCQRIYIMYPTVYLCSGYLHLAKAAGVSILLHWLLEPMVHGFRVTSRSHNVCNYIGSWVD